MSNVFPWVSRNLHVVYLLSTSENLNTHYELLDEDFLRNLDVIGCSLKNSSFRDRKLLTEIVFYFVYIFTFSSCHLDFSMLAAAALSQFVPISSFPILPS